MHSTQYKASAKYRWKHATHITQQTLHNTQHTASTQQIWLLRQYTTHGSQYKIHNTQFTMNSKQQIQHTTHNIHKEKNDAALFILDM